MHRDTNLNKLDYTTIVQQARAASTLVLLCPAFLQVEVSGHGLVESSFNTCLAVSGFCLQVQVSGHGLVDSGS